MTWSVKKLGTMQIPIFVIWNVSLLNVQFSFGGICLNARRMQTLFSVVFPKNNSLLGPGGETQKGWARMKRVQMLDVKGGEEKRWQERESEGEGEREVRDCFTNRIPLINHPVWTAGGFKTGRNGIPTWKCRLPTRILQKNISCQTPQRKGAG